MRASNVVSLQRELQGHAIKYYANKPKMIDALEENIRHFMVDIKLLEKLIEN